MIDLKDWIHEKHAVCIILQYSVTGFQRDTLFKRLYTANNNKIFLSVIYLIV